MDKSTEIYGIRSVIEAINSSKDIDKVFIQTGLKGKLIGQLESLIRKKNINFSFVQKQKLDRLSKKNHQGVIAWIAPIKFYTIDSFSTVIEKSKKGWKVELNKSTLPAIQIEEGLAEKVKYTIKKNENDKKFVSEAFNSAKWLLRAIEQRNSTTLKVAVEILKKQKEFFNQNLKA